MTTASFSARAPHAERRRIAREPIRHDVPFAVICRMLSVGPLVAALCAFAGTAPASAASSFFVTPTNGPVEAPWSAAGLVDTGIDLAAGESVVITATGSAKTNVNASATGPDGGIDTCFAPPHCPLAHDPAYSLIAKVASGDFVNVGSGPTTVTGTGRIHLAYNDGNYSDNDFAGNGGYTASIAFPAPPCTHDGRGCPPWRMTGAGHLTSGGEVVRHEFELSCDHQAEMLSKRFAVRWRAEGSSGAYHRFDLSALHGALCTDNPAISPDGPAAPFDTFLGRGIGTFDGVAGAHADWVATDAGEPGSADRLQVTIRDAGGDVVLEAEGALAGGNHQAHS